MEENLISKKELLELANISYGQLYRWKRKGLIPDEWFIRKSTFTGQETFFPKAKVLSRIGKILSRKEDVSLDDLADVFSPSYDDVNLNTEEIIRRGVATADMVKFYIEFTGGRESLDFNDILSVYILDKHIASGNLSLVEGHMMLEVLKEEMMKFIGNPSEVFLARKLGVFCCFAVSPPCEICTDSGFKIIGRINIPSVIEELKLKLF